MHSMSVRRRSGHHDASVHSIRAAKMRWVSKANFNTRFFRFTACMTDSATPLVAYSLAPFSRRQVAAQSFQFYIVDNKYEKFVLCNFIVCIVVPCHQVSRNRDQSQQAGFRPLDQVSVSRVFQRSNRHSFHFVLQLHHWRLRRRAAPTSTDARHRAYSVRGYRRPFDCCLTYTKHDS